LVVPDTLWRWVAKKIYAATPPIPPSSAPSNQRTYRGVFRQYGQFATHPKDFFFEIEEDGATLKVPVEGSHFLESLRPGDIVQIETLVGANKYAEIVQRVKNWKEQPKPHRGPIAQGPAGY